VRRGCLPRLHEDSGDKIDTVGIRHFFQEKVDYLRKFDIFQLLNAEVILKSSTKYRSPQLSDYTSRTGIFTSFIILS
jgi:hypothetical protein